MAALTFSLKERHGLNIDTCFPVVNGSWNGEEGFPWGCQESRQLIFIRIWLAHQTATEWMPKILVLCFLRCLRSRCAVSSHWQGHYTMSPIISHQHHVFVRMLDKKVPSNPSLSPSATRSSLRIYPPNIMDALIHWAMH